jgi:hypothetical protein
MTGPDDRPQPSMTAGLTPMNSLSGESDGPGRAPGRWRSRRVRVIAAVVAVVVIAAVVVGSVIAANRHSGPSGTYAGLTSSYNALQAEIQYAPAATSQCHSIACAQGEFGKIATRVQALADALARTAYPTSARAEAHTALTQIRAVAALLEKAQTASISDLRGLAKQGDVLTQLQTAQTSVQKLFAELGLKA